MGCSDSRPVADRPGSGIITLWGDYFTPETRTLVNMLDLCGVIYKFERVDTLNLENKKDSYV